MAHSSSFHAHHSPMGAHSSFTIGMFGATGGLAAEKGAPASSAVFIGYKTASGLLTYLPFFSGHFSEMERYVDPSHTITFFERTLAEREIERDYGWATDRFKAPNITVEVVTPFFGIPDPKTASEEELKFASCPVSFLSITLKNDSDEDWEGFFGLDDTDRWTPLSVADGQGLKGAVTRHRMGFATRDDVNEFIDFDIRRALSRTHTTPCFLIAPVAGIHFEVKAGETRTVSLALGYYLGGQVTFNYSASYWYTKYFKNLPEVFNYALDNQDKYMAEAEARDKELEASNLSDDQKFLIAHATRSYFGSTEWLDDGKPLWLVNEGEYLMMNTFDLTVDMIFFELRFNPWTVRNVLEQYVDRYSYVDQVFSPNDPDTLYEGGLSFTHDMGVANHFSPSAYSSYECSGLDRECFSYMTCEQLTNWLLCAGVYTAKTNDMEFVKAQQDTFEKCMQSLLNRDNPDPAKRNGLMGFDSSRTKGGGEITTYDSLDHSLGQARNNVYLAGKSWASFLVLEQVFNLLGETEKAKEAQAAAKRCADTLAASYDEKLGFIPAVIEGGNESAIIPAAEALVYPYEMGLMDAVKEDGPYGNYIKALKKHIQNILKPGVCLYPDGGWKLSSTADNSWMSKICLCQYVVRKILGIRYAGEAKADEAHVQWETEGSKDQACSDQFSSGTPIGSRYYPRIVTSILWMNE